MSTDAEISSQPPAVQLRIDDPQLPLLCFSGDWSGGARLPEVEDSLQQLTARQSVKLGFDSEAIGVWDTLFVTWVLRLTESAKLRGLEVDHSGLPEGVQRLIRLASSVPERAGTRRGGESEGWLTRIGNQAYRLSEEAKQLFTFLGEVTAAMLRMFSGKARFRFSDLSLFIQQTGIDALPIVSLISILVGLILAFIGALQLKLFGAQVYIANLVGIAMVREMGAMMAAIIMAGRTGAAFSAQLGTMQVNEEIDAFRTLGIDPVEFLVLPRVIALTLMMPLLCIYADLLGIIGGMLVGIGLFDITPTQYIKQTAEAVSLTAVFVGLVKSVVFGVLIGLAGCLKGIQCGRSASAVGEATTSAVVTAIVAIVVADAVMTLIFNALDI